MPGCGLAGWVLFGGVYGMKKMRWYFIDWDIYNSSGVLYKWSNQTIESDATPDDVMIAARKRIANELGLVDSQCRARSFNKI